MTSAKLLINPYLYHLDLYSKHEAYWTIGVTKAKGVQSKYHPPTRRLCLHLRLQNQCTVASTKMETATFNKSGACSRSVVIKVLLKN